MLILRKCLDGEDTFERVGIINGVGDEPEIWFKGVEESTLTIL